MSKKIYALLIGIFIFSISMNAQLSIGFTGDNVDAGDEVVVDVTASNFTGIPAAQFSINWDSLVLNFVSFSNLNPNLTGFSIGASLNNPGPNPENLPGGQISFAWFASDGEPVTLVGDDVVLFSIHFNANGEPCDETVIDMTDTPLEGQTSNEDFEPGPPPVSTPLTIQINGTNCGGGGPDDVTFSIIDYALAAGEDTCIQITVDNFTDVEGFQFPLTWDPDVLSFNSFGVVDGTVPGAFGIPNPDTTGELTILWTDPSGNSLTLDDGTAILEICFSGIGNSGDISDIDFITITDVGTSIIGGNGTIAFNAGKVTLTDGPVASFKLIASDEVVTENGNVCVDISCEDFENISGMQGTMSWDVSILSYTGIDIAGGSSNPNLPGLIESFFSENDGILTFTWTSPSSSGINVDDGTVLFSVCFDTASDCDDAPPSPTSPFTFVETPSVSVPWQAYIGDLLLPITITPLLDNGSVTYDCPTGECIVINVDHPDCAGEAGGNITVNLTGANQGCSCVWTDANGDQVGPILTTPNCNLLGVEAGTYNLVVTCGIDVYCSSTDIEVIDPSPITVSGNTTAIGCSNLGSIQVSAAGGTGTYTYAWSGGLSGNDLVEVSSPGNYCVTVTDSNDCVAEEKCFDVLSNIDDLGGSINVTSEISCNGANDGVLTAIPTGGCPSYSFKWNDFLGSTTASLSDLGPGTYKVTITDNQTPPDEVVLSAFITEPDAIVIISTNTVDASAANDDGSIDIEVEGGIEPYTFEWSDNSTINTEDRIGLAADTFIVTIIDANGCEIVSDDIIIELISSDPSVENIVVDEPGSKNGYAISCNGVCDGIVDFDVTGGTLPITAQYKSSSQEKSIVVTSFGAQSFSGICGGISDAVITIIDADNKTFTSNEFSVSQPPLLIIGTEIQCSDEGENNGSINLNVTGGVKNYSYAWDNGSAQSARTDLAIGDYGVIVTDANGCQMMANELKVKDCGDGGGLCYTAMAVITPNGDGRNDQFVINCANTNDNTLKIYNRYGEDVYSTSNYDNTWEGDSLPEGGYMWILNVSFDNGDNKTYKGTMAILR